MTSERSELEALADAEKKKARARRILRDAVNSGQVTRPVECSRCLTTPKETLDGRAAIQGHHADYDKPLDVEWLCAKCHRAETPLPEVPGAPVFGERNGQAKLTADDVLQARETRKTGLTYRRIAEMYGVDKKTIMRAIKGEQWAHVK